MKGGPSTPSLDISQEEAEVLLDAIECHLNDTEEAERQIAEDKSLSNLEQMLAAVHQHRQNRENLEVVHARLTDLVNT